MSGRVFQNIVLQFKDAVDTEIGVIDAEGTVIACTELSEIGSHWSELVSSINDAEESVVPLAGKTFKALSGWNGHFDFAVFAYGENEMSRAACSMAAVALNAAKSYYEEKYDKVSFIKNIISDNIMLSDLYIRAKELHVETELNRGVFLIRRLDERFEGLTVETVQNIFPDRQTSFALSMGESDVVLIQQLGENVGTRDLEKTAQLIEETLRENGESTVVVARAPSEIVFIDYAHIIKRCEKACDHHSLLVRNVLRLVADKTVRLSERIQVLSCRSIREKLLCYFNLSAARAGSLRFVLPFSFSELADYICADRSAMMRELGHMRAAGLVYTQGRWITLPAPHLP